MGFFGRTVVVRKARGSPGDFPTSGGHQRHVSVPAVRDHDVSQDLRLRPRRCQIGMPQARSWRVEARHHQIAAGHRLVKRVEHLRLVALRLLGAAPEVERSELGALGVKRRHDFLPAGDP